MATTAGMRAYSYWVFGLQVTSELSLPELYAGAEPADVVIRRGPVPDDLPDAQAHGVLYQAAPGVFRLKVNGIARYLVTDGREIVVQADADADASAVRVFLLGSAMGALLLQRGILPLHTSAIESAGRCVAFAGNSGRGKSTLAAAFHGRGYRVLADDVLAVRDGRGVPPMAYSGSRELKLWADALDLLEIEADGLRRARPQVEKSCLPTGAVRAARAAADLACLPAGPKQPGPPCAGTGRGHRQARGAGAPHLPRALPGGPRRQIGPLPALPRPEPACASGPGDPPAVRVQTRRAGRSRGAGLLAVTPIVWLASYPKSGNTWFRAFVANSVERHRRSGGHQPARLRRHRRRPRAVRPAHWDRGVGSDRRRDRSVAPGCLPAAG